MEDPAEAVLSLQDVLEEDQQLEQTANAVLGPSDDTRCTYPKGYVDRQALYACATCYGTKGATVTGATGEKGEGEAREEGELAGVCLACSLHCHDGHDLYELYTKRHFRCDCGNSKFPNMTCSLCPEKDPVNSENKYNHNFRGLYCLCERPYPDSEDEVEDEMIQCTVCEDWFHSRHLGGGGAPDSYDEMVCDRCVESCDFLRAYQLHLTVRVGGGEEREGGVVDVTGSCESSKVQEDEAESSSCGPETSFSRHPEKEEGEGATLSESSGNGQAPPAVRESVSERGEGGEAATSAQQSGSVGVCELQRRRRLLERVGRGGGAGYFAANWRSQLCKCRECLSLYRGLGCQFLLDAMDSIASYEEKATSQPSMHESAMTAFSSSLDRVQQVEALHQYNEMKADLMEFLHGFAREGKVVSKRDVEGFFESMQARKRRRLETGEGVPPASCHF